MSLRSKLIRGHVFKVRTLSVACKLSHAGRGGCRSWLCWLGPYSPDLGPGVHPLHPIACTLLGRQYRQGQDCLEVIFLPRSRLEKGHILKLRFIGGYVFWVKVD